MLCYIWPVSVRNLRNKYLTTKIGWKIVTTCVPVLVMSGLGSSGWLETGYADQYDLKLPEICLPLPQKLRICVYVCARCVWLYACEFKLYRWKPEESIISFGPEVKHFWAAQSRSGNQTWFFKSSQSVLWTIEPSLEPYLKFLLHAQVW